MRNITRRASLAFRGGDNFTLGNTAVTYDSHTGIKQMRLHGNLIAETRDGELYMTLAGWNTPTTRERLNGLLEMHHISKGFCQKDWEPYYNDELIGDNEWLHIT